MTTYSQVLNILPSKGYGKELNISKDGGKFDEGNEFYEPEQLIIVKTYRFEGASDPSDMAVIYLLHSHSGEKGFLLNAYGTYSDDDNQYYNDFIKRVPVEENDEIAKLLGWSLPRKFGYWKMTRSKFILAERLQQFIFNKPTLNNLIMQTSLITNYTSVPQFWMAKKQEESDKGTTKKTPSKDDSAKGKSDDSKGAKSTTKTTKK